MGDFDRTMGVEEPGEVNATEENGHLGDGDVRSVESGRDQPEPGAIASVKAVAPMRGDHLHTAIDGEENVHR